MIFIVPVILYLVFAFINPDGVRWGGTYKTCWVSSKSNKCLNNSEVTQLGGGINMTAWWMITILVGFVIAVINLIRVVCGHWLLGVAYIDIKWSVIWSIWLIISRSIHGGRVIGGNLCGTKH